MGPYIATSSHLRMMQLTIGKDIHGLREKDINHKDKQNFEAVLHIYSEISPSIGAESRGGSYKAIH